MASESKEVFIDFSPFFKIFSDGSILRTFPAESIPASDDPASSVRSKDVVIDPNTGVSVRIFLPGGDTGEDSPPKLPLVVYVHGGAYCIGSASSPAFHYFISAVVNQANLAAVSVDYRLAPEHPLPEAYDDSWAAFRWVASHAAGDGPDPWLNEWANFQRVFLGGESAGANIANDLAVRAGAEAEALPGVEVVGLFLLHPFFGGKEVDKLYKHLCPSSTGRDDDPRLNPAVDPRIGRMAARRVMFFTADEDFLAANARAYCEALKKSDWKGEVDAMETAGEGHCFYLMKPTSEKAIAVVARLLAFLKSSP